MAFWVMLIYSKKQKFSRIKKKKIKNHNIGEAKVVLQFKVCKTQTLFLYSYLLIITLFSISTTVNLLLSHTVSDLSPLFRHNKI